MMKRELGENPKQTRYCEFQKYSLGTLKPLFKKANEWEGSLQEMNESGDLPEY